MSMVRLQVSPAGAGQLLQPLNAPPAAGVAVKITPLFVANCLEHTPGQLIPPPVTVPVPVPPSRTFRVGQVISVIGLLFSRRSPSAGRLVTKKSLALLSVSSLSSKKVGQLAAIDRSSIWPSPNAGS